MTLIRYWPLNEESGNTAYDHSGNENHGAINDGGDSTVPGATGILGQNAYSFDENNDYVQLDYTGSPETLTISVWVWVSSLNDWDSVVSTFGSNESEQSYELLNNDGGGVRFHVSNDRMDSNQVLNQKSWHHIVATWDGNTAKIYIDGNLDSSKDGMTAGSNNINWEIGRSPRNDNHYGGKISEVRIYDRPLTQSEIQYLYSVGKRGLQTTSKKTS